MVFILLGSLHAIRRRMLSYLEARTSCVLDIVNNHVRDYTFGGCGCVEEFYGCRDRYWTYARGICTLASNPHPVVGSSTHYWNQRIEPRYGIRDSWHDGFVRNVSWFLFSVQFCIGHSRRPAYRKNSSPAPTGHASINSSTTTRIGSTFSDHRR